LQFIFFKFLIDKTCQLQYVDVSSPLIFSFTVCQSICMEYKWQNSCWTLICTW